MEEVHVGYTKGLPQFEILKEILPRILHDFEMNILRRRVIGVPPDQLLLYECVEVFLIVLSPATRWEFSHDDIVPRPVPHTLHHPCVLLLMNDTLETPEPGSHRDDVLSSQNPFNIRLDIFGVEWRHIATETRPNTLCPIHE